MNNGGATDAKRPDSCHLIGTENLCLIGTNGLRGLLQLHEARAPAGAQKPTSRSASALECVAARLQRRRPRPRIGLLGPGRPGGHSGADLTALFDRDGEQPDDGVEGIGHSLENTEIGRWRSRIIAPAVIPTTLVAARLH